jgi:hypothetical protein
MSQIHSKSFKYPLPRIVSHKFPQFCKFGSHQLCDMPICGLTSPVLIHTHICLILPGKKESWIAHSSGTHHPSSYASKFLFIKQNLHIVHLIAMNSLFTSPALDDVQQRSTNAKHRHIHYPSPQFTQVKRNGMIKGSLKQQPSCEKHWVAGFNSYFLATGFHHTRE